MYKYRSDNKNVLKRRIAQYSLFIFTPLIFGICSASAADISWQGGVSTDWNTSGNWSTNQIPNPTTSVIINSGSDKPAVVDGTTASAGWIAIGSARQEQGTPQAQNGALNIINGGSLEVMGDVVVGESAGSKGSIIVSGQGSTLKAESGSFYLGADGEGDLTISDGAQWITRNSGKNIYTGTGGHAGTSTITITGAGTKADLNWLLMSYSGSPDPAYQNDHTTVFNLTDGAEVNMVGIDTAYTGKGILRIDGGTLNTDYMISSWAMGADSDVVISGPNSEMNVNIRAVNGTYGTGTILIEKGGKFTTTQGTGSDAGFVAAYYATSTSRVDVTGAGSLWTSTGTTAHAYDGKSHIGITDGGKAHLEEIYSSFGKDAYSTTLVSGAQSELTVDGILLVGAGGTSHLLAEKGAKVTAGYGAAANEATAVGSITVTGEGTKFTNTGEMAIGIEGKGNLTVTDKASLLSADKIGLAEEAGSEGVLNIGTGGHAGVVEAPEITGGAGDAIVNFNHIDRIDFDAAMKGRLNVNHINQGVTTLFGESDYTGTTKVSAGTYRAGKEGVFSENSHYIAANGGIIDLNNFDQSMEALTNQGRVYFGGVPGTELHVGNNYTGEGGTLYLSTVLGKDDSLTDRMYVGADTSGHSYVKVTNVGGLGAQTKEGIKIIDVTGQSDGKFSLLGDYVYKGEQVVVGGAYRYKLNQGATSTPDDGNWYLQSEGYQKGVVPYEVYPQLLLNHLPTLQQRVGNRFWNNAGNKQLAQGADIPAGFAPPDETGVLIEENAVWGRMEGSHTSIKSRYSTSGADYDYNHFRMQAGIDGMLRESDNGKLIGGLTAHYDRKNADIYTRDIDSDIAVNGYGFGGTLTWYGENGFYIDNQAEVTWYKSDIGADGILVNGNKGFGYSLSVETGKRITLNEYWSMTPQGQLIYANASFDSFTDRFGADVSRKKADSLEGRLGLTLDHQNSWLNDRGMMNRRYVYGIANLYTEFLGGTEVDVSGIRFANKRDRVWGGLGLGGSYNWNDDKYSIYGEGLVLTSFNHFADSYGYKGTIGLRVKW
jgi:fibronectin-binding autotransporter adhesin